ncbi:hypothetical protein Tco_0895661 [Tanacetum coccineum]|uniref:Uncharacterized protein n=1 Tax=Tanacetum coccineum TaxID=301880 RepID=A0ABQ5CLG5_9ASTR
MNVYHVGIGMFWVEHHQGQCVNLQCRKVVVVGKKHKVRWRIRQEERRRRSRNFRGGVFMVFKPLLNIKVKFWEGELETTFVLQNSALFEIHMPWLKLIQEKGYKMNFDLRHPVASSRQRRITTRVIHYNDTPAESLFMVKNLDSHRRGLIAHRDGLDTM